MTPQEQPEYKSADLKEVWKISKWAFKFVYSINPGYVSTYFVFAIISSLIAFVNSFIFAKIIDVLVKIAGSQNHSIDAIYPYIGMLIGFNIISSLISVFYRYATFAIRNISGPMITKFLYTKIKDLEIQTLEKSEVNNKIYRANTHLNDVTQFFMGITDVFVNLVTFVTSAVIVSRLIPFLVPILLLISIPRFFIDKKFRKIVYKFSFENTEEMRKAGMTANNLTTPSVLQEIFINKAFNFFDEKYSNFFEWFTEKRIQIQKSWYKGSYSTLFIGDLGTMYAYILIFLKYISKVISIGDVTFQMRTVVMLREAIFQSVISMNDLSEMSIKIKDTYELFQEKPAFPDGNIEIAKLEKGPSIKFDNVDFIYPNAEHKVISNFNLEIKPGEKLAIVGHNGAGKTTLVRLVCRMYQVNNGTLTINNQNINDLKSGSWYQNVGVLFQDFNTYPQFTVRENIYIGNPTEPLNENKIVKAAENADAINFINDFPKKFEQILSERLKGGIRPSTGQWQKIAIARFFYRDAPLVIFDEPTASIDAMSEYRIFNKIYEFFKDKTVIIISHRFSTVRNADRIVMIEQGKIIEEGTHDQLMELNGSYAKSFLLQAEGYSK